MTSPQCKELLNRSPVAIIPFAALEQHGPHLPLDTDSFLCSTVAERAAARVADEVGVVVCPVVPYGCSGHHMAFAGTVTLRCSTLIAVATDVCRSLIHHGVRKLLLLNGHGGNAAALTVAMNEVKLEHPDCHLAQIAHWTFAASALEGLRASPPGGMAHACEFETSLYLYLDPEHVVQPVTTRELPTPRLPGEVIDLFRSGPVNMAWVTTEITKSGVIGDATLATADKGKALLEAAVTALAQFLRNFARL